jgi:AraC family transcriptional regulator
VDAQPRFFRIDLVIKYNYIGAMAHAPLPGPDGLFTVTVPPRFGVDSSAVGWRGAFFTDLQAAPHGIVDHCHARFSVQQSAVPIQVRELRAGAAWTTVTPGVGVWRPGDEQRFEWQGGGGRQFLFVDPAMVEEVLDGPAAPRTSRRAPAEPIASPLAATLLQALVHDLQDGSPGGTLAGDSLIVALVVHLWGPGSERRGGSGLPAAACKRVLGYIEERLDTPVSLAELAQLARMSVRHFCRAFRASMGCSPHQYLLRQRVERAKLLIATREMALCDIAQAAGFADQSQFTRTFRKQLGITPAGYRAGC